MNGRRKDNILERILCEVEEIEGRLRKIEQTQKEILAIVSEQPPTVAQSLVATIEI